MLFNIIVFILFALVNIAYLVANIIMSIISIQDGSTIKEILSEQDLVLGKVGVSLMYWPTFLVLYIKSLLPINTKSCFDIFDDVDVNDVEIDPYVSDEFDMFDDDGDFIF